MYQVELGLFVSPHPWDAIPVAVPRERIAIPVAARRRFTIDVQSGRLKGVKIGRVWVTTVGKEGPSATVRFA